MQRILPLKISPKIVVDFSPIHGRGVFATEKIFEGEIIEECHFIQLRDREFQNLDAHLQEIIFSYPMGMDGLAVVLGFGSIYNHQNNNNATWETDTNLRLFRFYATKDIEVGEEICTNYLKFDKILPSDINESPF